MAACMPTCVSGQAAEEAVAAGNSRRTQQPYFVSDQSIFSITLRLAAAKKLSAMLISAD